MNNNFFQSLAALGLTGDITLVIKQNGPAMIVSVLVQNAKSGDAAKSIPPLVLTGTPQELDAGFIQKISEPLQQSSGLQLDIIAYQKALEEARKNSPMGKDAAKSGAEIKPPVDTGRQQFEQAMQPVDKLIDEKRYKQALLKMPKVEQFARFEEEIVRKKKQINEMLNTGTLFAAFGDPSEDTQEEAEEVEETENAQ